MKCKKDMVNSPEHYKQYKIINGEVIDLIEEVIEHYPKEVTYHIGNALKYILRAPFKDNMIQDLNNQLESAYQDILGIDKALLKTLKDNE